MATAAAVILIRERRVVEAFSAAAATSPERARPLETLGIESDGMALRRLQKRAVIRESAPGRFYLDVPTWDALRQMRHRMAFVMLAVLIVVLLLGVLAGVRTH
jgi:hypothetical protein